MLFIKSLIKNLLNGRRRQLLGSSKVRLEYRHFTFSCSLNRVLGYKSENEEGDSERASGQRENTGESAFPDGR